MSTTATDRLINFQWRMNDRCALIEQMVFISFRLGHNKLLLPFKGKPLIAHAVDTLLASSVDEIIVVLGHEADRVRAAIGERRVRFVENCNYHEGLGSSVHAGFAAIPSQTSAIMVYLADQPLLEPVDVVFLIRAFAEAGKTNKSIVVPLFRGQRGNPVIVNSSYKTSILAIVGETGCRRVIKENPDQVLTLGSTGGVIVAEICPVAGKKSDLFVRFDPNGVVAVEFHSVEPVAARKPNLNCG